MMGDIDWLGTTFPFPDGEISWNKRAALSMVRAGLAVVAIKPGEKEPRCWFHYDARGKKAADVAAQEAGTAKRDGTHLCGEHCVIIDEKQLSRVGPRKLLESGANLAVSPRYGARRIVIVDVDTDAERHAFLADWNERGDGVDPDTPLTVTSPGVYDVKAETWQHKDGGHFWFSVPDGIELPESPGKLKWCRCHAFSAPADCPNTWAAYWNAGYVLVPPSVRKEGPYRVTGEAHEAPAWLLELIREAGQRRIGGSGELNNDGNDSINTWAAATPWADILTAAGWTEWGTESCGCSNWSRPGHANPKTATAHDPGCGQMSTDGGHGFLHLWTDAWRPGGKANLTKLDFVAHNWHDGDHRAAMDALGIERSRRDNGVADDGDDVFVLGVASGKGEPAGGDPGVITPKPTPGRPVLDVTNAAVAADWLRDNVGVGPLAGMFRRGPEIVHTPREGEDGYIPLSDSDEDADGPAQIRPVTPTTLASRVQYMFQCVKLDKERRAFPALFPVPSARVACDVPDLLPNLRALRGIVHSPIIRPDGSVLSSPGFDASTGLLYLPPADLKVPDVAQQPTAGQVQDAVALLETMTCDFRFLTPHDRANYYGLLLTPVLRALIPPPYKLGAIGAPQPGSGKTLLANILRTVHGGVFRSEMPGDDNELGKQITAILSVTTGPVIHFDNVTGTLRSSKLAGLLTSSRWDDRPLGSTDYVSRDNDRLWVITGNNLSIGGDLTRRTLWVTIDPAVPDPHLRTGFRIENLEQWVKAHRGAILHALLTLVQNWVSSGRPAQARGSDGYAGWVAAVEGILATAGVEGRFAHAESERQTVGSDDEDWADLLAAIQGVFGDRAWTVREVLDKVDTSSITNVAVLGSSLPIPMEALPAELADKVARSGSARSVAKSLGRWLMNREGRWARRLTVRSAGKDRAAVKLWRVESAGNVGAGAGFGAANPAPPSRLTS